MKLTLLLLSAMVAWTQAICHMCGSASQMPKWWNYQAPGQNGKTCKEVYVGLANVAENSGTCTAIQNNAGKFCCGDTAPTTGSSGGSSYQYTGPYGTQPDCPICRTRDVYPGNPTEIISARYVGTFSCATLYHRGLNGMTPRDMCFALQGYAWNVCKCADGSAPPSSGGNSGNSGSKPSPAPPPNNNPYNRKNRPPTSRKRIRTGRGGAAGGN